MRLLLLLAVSTAACSGDDDGGPVNCEALTTDDELVIGFSKPTAGGMYDVSLVSVTPAPPARTLNEWVVQVMTTAAPAAPLAGATLYVTPFMPQHGHGAGIDVEVEAMPAAGQYKLAPINLHMPGLWEVTIEVETPSGLDSVLFKPCIPN